MVRSRAATALTVGTIAMLGLRGCVLNGTDRPEPTPSASGETPIVVAEAESEPTILDLPEGTVIDTATLESELPGVRGRVEVVAARTRMLGPPDARFQIRIHDAVLPPGTAELNRFRLVAKPTSGSWPCIGAWGGMALAGWLGGGAEWVAPIAPLPNPGSADPSYLEALVVLEPNEGPDANGCSFRPVIRADFVWSMPDIRPDLKPVDRGPTLGAMGAVESHDGVPVGYTVARNDVLDEVAARFEISVDDLLFLNPARQNGGFAAGNTLLEGERLNFDKKLR